MYSRDSFIMFLGKRLLCDSMVVVYLDGIIIQSENEEGVEKLKHFLKVVSDNGLEFNFKKY